MRERRDSAPQGPDALPVRLLSATLAHELNNIVASLQGFVDLGSEMSRDKPTLQNIFSEVRLSAERAAMLAADLAVLGVASARLEPVTLVALIAAARGNGAGDRRSIGAVQWESDGQVRVQADIGRATHALGVLQRLAGNTPQPAAALRCRDSSPVGVPAPARCLTCGADVGERNGWLVQGLPAGRLRALTAAPTREHLSAPQLRLAVLERVAHEAGWHLVVAREPDSLSLVLPMS